VPASQSTTYRLTTSRYPSKLDWSRPLSVWPNSLNVGLFDCTIMASMWITNFDPSQRQNVSMSSVDHGLLVCKMLRFKRISKLNWLQRQSASLNTLDHGLRVYLLTGSIRAFMFWRSWYAGKSWSSHNQGVLVHHKFHSISISWKFSIYTWVQSVARLTGVIDIESLRYIIRVILQCSQSCKYEKHIYRSQNAVWVLNPEAQYSENMAPCLKFSTERCRAPSCCRCLRLSCAVVSPATTLHYSVS